MKECVGGGGGGGGGGLRYLEYFILKKMYVSVLVFIAIANKKTYNKLTNNKTPTAIRTKNQTNSQGKKTHTNNYYHYY